MILKEFNNILTTLLTEARGMSADELCDAIDNKYRLNIKYDDEEEPEHTDFRTVEPYVYGLTKAGNACFRGFQWEGDTRRGVPKWKLFRLDRVLECQPLPGHFVVEPKFLRKGIPSYNDEGDKSMSVVFKQVQFGDNNNISQREEPQQQEVEVPNREWLSPLDRARQQRQINLQNLANNKNSNPQVQIKRGAIETDSLDTALNIKPQWEQDLEKRLGLATDRKTAMNMDQARYEAGSRSEQERNDRRVMQKRDARWEKAADTRPLHSKNSINNMLQEPQQDNENEDNTNEE